GISHNRELKRPAQNGVNYLVAAQKSKDGARWGWRYLSKKHLDEALAASKIDQAQHDDLVQEVDISVTTWVVMALKSAILVKLDVPSDVLGGALEFARYNTGKDGLMGYQNPYQAGTAISGPGDNYTYHTATMSALGMLVRTFVSHDPDDPFLELAA